MTVISFVALCAFLVLAIAGFVVVLATVVPPVRPQDRPYALRAAATMALAVGVLVLIYGVRSAS